MAQKPSVNVLLPPVWPLARARRVEFLSTLALRCEYVLGRKKRTPRPVRPYFMLIPFESMSSAFPVPLPTKASTQDLPATKFFLFRGTLDIDCGVLEHRRKSFALHTRFQLLGLCPPSLHQPAKSLLEVPYPVSLPVIIVAICVSI